MLEAAASKEMVSKWEEESSGSEEESLTDEQKEHKRKFREWRKKHYNEFHAVKRARELIKKVERDHLSPFLFTLTLTQEHIRTVD